MAKRLEWDNLTVQAATIAIGQADLPPESPLPSWCEVFKEILEQVLNHNSINQPSTSSDPRAEPVQAIPFSDLLRPYVSIAMHKLNSRITEDPRCITASVLNDLSTYLKRQISSILTPSLYTEFSLFRSVLQAQLFVVSCTPLETIVPNPVYARFITRMSTEEGFKGFYSEYPVLARLVSTTIDDWVNSIAELLERFRNDRSTIVQSLLSGKDPGRVTSIDISSSDPHNKGRRVAILQFANGLKLVYKPRSLEPELSLSWILNWVNKHGIEQLLYAPSIISCDHYGWMEFIAHRPCFSRRDVEAYYFRAGALLGIAYLLGVGPAPREFDRQW